MNRLFNLDSPIMVFLSKLADLMILNIITFICCLPIVTIGASLTAMHYVLLKLVRKEEGYIVKAFLKSFKENFKQATICWLIILLIFIIFIGDFWILNYSGIVIHQAIGTAFLIVVILTMMGLLYVFPVLSRFENPVSKTFKNSYLMAIYAFPKTIAMMLLNLLPLVCVYYSFNFIPVIFVLGISGPAYMCAFLYSATFKKFEPEVEKERDDGDYWILPEEEI